MAASTPPPVHPLQALAPAVPNCPTNHPPSPPPEPQTNISSVAVRCAQRVELRHGLQGVHLLKLQRYFGQWRLQYHRSLRSPATAISAVGRPAAFALDSTPGVVTASRLLGATAYKAHCLQDQVTGLGLDRRAGSDWSSSTAFEGRRRHGVEFTSKECCLFYQREARVNLL